MIKIEDIKLLLKVKDIELTLDDDELRRYIELMTKEVYSLLGISSEYLTHHYYIFYRHYNKGITLPLSHVVDVKVKINGKLINKNCYTIDEENGIINFKNPFKFFNKDIDVKYITLLPPYILNNIESLLNELIVDGLKSQFANDVKKVEEGDVTVEYKDDESSYNAAKKINDIKSQLNSYLNHDTVMML